MSYKSILVISDQHAPYNHIDTLDFLAAIKKKYKPDCVVNIGDEMDWHSISFHDSHPGLYSPSHELKIAREFKMSSFLESDTESLSSYGKDIFISILLVIVPTTTL